MLCLQLILRQSHNEPTSQTSGPLSLSESYATTPSLNQYYNNFYLGLIEGISMLGHLMFS